MTSQISKIRVFAVVFCLLAGVSIHAQEPSQMQRLISQSLARLQQPTPEAGTTGPAADGAGCLPPRAPGPLPGSQDLVFP